MNFVFQHPDSSLIQLTDLFLNFDAKEQQYSIYILMEKGGQTLESFIKAGTIHFVQLFQIIRDTIIALVEMHIKGIAHRDIKPENIVLVYNKWKPFDLGVTQLRLATVLFASGSM